MPEMCFLFGFMVQSMRAERPSQKVKGAAVCERVLGYQKIGLTIDDFRLLIFDLESGADTEVVKTFDGGGGKHSHKKRGNRKRGKPKLLNGCQMKV